MKTNYLVKIEENLKAAVEQAKIDHENAMNNFYNLKTVGTLDIIEYEDYVKNECPYYNMMDKDSLIGRHEYEILMWIVNEGKAEIIEFYKANESNDAAMALLDLVLTTKHYNEIKTLYANTVFMSKEEFEKEFNK